jgi:hypothetical protein
MKNIKRILILVVAICLASLGLNAQAETVSKKVIKDLNTKDSGSILMSIYCIIGPGGNR